MTNCVYQPKIAYLRSVQRIVKLKAKYHVYAHTFD